MKDVDTKGIGGSPRIIGILASLQFIELTRNHQTSERVSTHGCKKSYSKNNQPTRQKVSHSMIDVTDATVTPADHPVNESVHGSAYRLHSLGVGAQTNLRIKSSENAS